MRKFSRIAILFLLSLLCFSSCKNTEIDIPDGLQIIKISDTEGYHFFGPEGWVIANDGDIATSYIASSGVVKASLTFTKTDCPEGGLKEYFEFQKPLFAYDISVINEPDLRLGNSNGENYAVVYTFSFNEINYASMQIFAKNGDGFYIFTYTAEGDPTSEDSYYQKYIEAVRLCAESFEFTEKSNDSSSDGGQNESNAYKLVSNKDISGFELYLPEKYSVIVSDAYVSAKISESANLFLSKASDTNVSVLDYLKMRKNEILKFADTDSVTDIKISLKTEYNPESEIFNGWNDVMNVMPEYEENLIFGNLDDNLVVSYEYTYAVNGIKYRVYQIIGIKQGLFNTGLGAAGYVFTYTATDENYADNIDEIKNILQRIKF